MLAGLLPVVLAVWLSGCATEVKGTATSEGACLAPEISTWAQADWDALAAELEAGRPLTLDEEAHLADALQTAINRGSLWEVFPATFAAVAEYVIIRAAIEEC